LGAVFKPWVVYLFPIATITNCTACCNLKAKTTTTTTTNVFFHCSEGWEPEIMEALGENLSLASSGFLNSCVTAAFFGLRT
jgi:hypothetical protein